MKRLTILALQYYRLLLLYNIAFSLLAAFLFVVGLGAINVGSFFLIKVTGFGSALTLHYYLAKNEYYYFRNAGCRITHLFVAVFVVDFLIYLSITIFSNCA